MIKHLRRSLALAALLVWSSAAIAAYDIVQVTPTYIGGTQTIVTAPSGPVIIPGLSATLTLSSAAHSVTCKYSIPVQTDAANSSVYVQLTRGGVPLGVGLPLYSSLGIAIMSMTDTVSDTPGYIGPLTYAIQITPIVGSGRAPANFVGAGSIQCNEVAP